MGKRSEMLFDIGSDDANHLFEEELDLTAIAELGCNWFVGFPFGGDYKSSSWTGAPSVRSHPYLASG